MSRIKCPNCKSTNTARIMYGEPDLSEKLQAESDAGRVHFGGCIVSFNDPNRHCNDCETQWNTKPKDIYRDIDEELITVILPTINND